MSQGNVYYMHIQSETLSGSTRKLRVEVVSMQGQQAWGRVSITCLFHLYLINEKKLTSEPHSQEHSRLHTWASTPLLHRPPNPVFDEPYCCIVVEQLRNNINIDENQIAAMKVKGRIGQSQTLVRNKLNRKHCTLSSLTPKAPKALASPLSPRWESNWYH